LALTRTTEIVRAGGAGAFGLFSLWKTQPFPLAQVQMGSSSLLKAYSSAVCKQFPFRAGVGHLLPSCLHLSTVSSRLILCLCCPRVSLRGGGSRRSPLARLLLSFVCLDWVENPQTSSLKSKTADG